MAKKNSSILPAEDLSIICTQLSLMQNAGIGSEDALGILAEEALPKHSEILSSVEKSMMKGMQLDEALRESGSFPQYMISMVSIGILSGTLDRVLTALAEYYRREAETNAAIRRAIIYPSFMAVLITAIFLILMAKVLPVFQQVFSELGMTMSPAAQTMLNIGSASREIAAVFSLILIVCAAFIFYLMKAPGGAALASKLSKKFFSSLDAYKSVDRSHFANAMSLMLASGLSIDTAMEKCEELLTDSALKPSIVGCRAAMEAGTAFPKAVSDNNIFSGIESGLLSAAFRAGSIETAMDSLSARAQSRAEDSLGALLSRFELILVLVLCVAVGFTLLSVMLPLLGVMTSIGG